MGIVRKERTTMLPSTGNLCYLPLLGLLVILSRCYYTCTLSPNFDGFGHLAAVIDRSDAQHLSSNRE